MVKNHWLPSVLSVMKGDKSLVFQILTSRRRRIPDKINFLPELCVKIENRGHL
jgi:hypothetical protein